MKKVSKLLLIILSLMVFIPNVFAAASKYETVVTIDGEIVNEEFYIILGYKGEEILDLNVKLGYDSRYLDLSGIYPLNDFTVEDEDVDAKSPWDVKQITAFVNDTTEETNYVMLTFKLTSQFKVGKAVDVFLYEQEATGTEEYNFKDTPKVFTIRRAEDNEITLIVKEISKTLKLEYWVRDNIYLIIFIVILVIAVFFTILIIPGRHKRESRAKKIRTNKEQNSRKIDYKIEHEEDSEEFKASVDAFNGNGAKKDYNIEKNNPQFVHDSSKAFNKKSNDLGVINPTDFSNKDEK